MDKNLQNYQEQQFLAYISYYFYYYKNSPILEERQNYFELALETAKESLKKEIQQRLKSQKEKDQWNQQK